VTGGRGVGSQRGEGPGDGDSPRLDEDTAWALLQALPRGLGEGSAPVRAEVPAAGIHPAWLLVHPSGRWAASGRPTDPARGLLELYLPLVLPRRLVLGQLGQSLDGRIATEEGHSHYVTGPEDILRLHRVRALVDAVVVGAGTVAADDPRLTVRQAPGANPVRVVLDPDGRLAEDRRVFRDGASPTLVIRRGARGGGGDGDAGGGSVPGGTYGEGGVEELLLPMDGAEGFAPDAILSLLADRGLHRVLVEGGGITVSRFLAAGALDRLHVTVAPLLIGSGRPALTLPPVQTLDQALRPRCRTFPLDGDTLFDLELPRGRPWPVPHPDGGTGLEGTGVGSEGTGAGGKGTGAGGDGGSG
jgi:diaminohydroxyphosphoribosylaminopyrimidine deaminase / 5-amino-6-(5-phosphoribosylamino)uracil reductase